MGKKASRGEVRQQKGLDAFQEAVRRQLADRQRVVRTFDVGGTGVKTALLSAAALRDFLRAPADGEDADPEREPEWIERPSQLGVAPGEDGFAPWLAGCLPRLRREADDPHVCFGVSVGGDVDHATGVINDWWPGGGHPREWDDGRRSPLVAELMGLPPGRTFVLHDGEAHLLGCGRSIVPPPGLGCFALGTGVGFGLSDSLGAVVDPSSHNERSHHLSGCPVSGAPYPGIWRQWLEGGASQRVEELMAREFANMSKPWRTPWVSLVLGRRGMELAEAAHDCPEPSEVPDDEARAPAVRAYGEQWLHFLRTQFAPQFAGGARRHPVERICFAGGVAELNWPILREALLEEGSDTLRALPAGAEEEQSSGASSKKNRPAPARGRAEKASLAVLPPAPRGSGLIGAAIYALGGAGGAAEGIWAP